MIIAEVTLHLELVNRSAIVHPNLCLLRIVPNPHSDVVAAAVAPDVVRHLESDDDDAHVDLARPFAKGVRALPFVEAPRPGVVIGGVVLVLTLTLSHLEVCCLETLTEGC